MIIYYSNFTWTIPCPHKHNAPLIIDPNTMKTRQISFQFFETVIWRSLQIIKIFRVTNHVELSQRNRRPALLGGTPVKYSISVALSPNDWIAIVEPF